MGKVEFIEKLKSRKKAIKNVRVGYQKLELTPLGWKVLMRVAVVVKDPKYTYAIERLLRGMNFQGVKTIKTYVGPVVVGYKIVYGLPEP